jgi:hypothetical protein
LGNRSLYHYCLAILIFFDITLPIALLVGLYFTWDSSRKTFLDKTLCGPSLAKTDDNANPDKYSCCAFSLSGTCLVLGLILFLIFVTISGVLGQSEDTFCLGYVSLSVIFPLVTFNFTALIMTVFSS